MEQTVKERIILYLRYKGIGYNKFESIAGISHGYIANLKSTPKKEQLAKILLAAPDLNRTWLLAGDGEMLNKTENAVISKMETTTDCEDAEIVDSFPILPEEVAVESNTDIEEYIEENSSELEQVNPSHKLAPANAAERILRTSMLPTFQPEDIVFVRFLPDRMKLCDGDIYYLNCKNRPTMIRHIKFEPDNRLRLVAQNPQYGDVIISRDDIINVGTIVGLLRMTFGDQYSEIEAIRRQKEEQIEKRDEQIDNMLDMQRELISEIREQGKRSARDRERMDELIDKLLLKL
jgi:phage repressor protein C with HTH and peptisase S24 domain